MTHIISTDDIQAKTVETVGLMLLHFRNDLLAQSFYRFSQTPFEITNMVNEQFEKGAKKISSFFLKDEQIGLEAKSQALKSSILLFSDKAGCVFDLVKNHDGFVQEYSRQRWAVHKEYEACVEKVKNADHMLQRIHMKFATDNRKQKEGNIKVDIDVNDIALLFEQNINILLEHAHKYIKESGVDLEADTLEQDTNTITVPHMGINLFLEEAEKHEAKSGRTGPSLK